MTTKETCRCKHYQRMHDGHGVCVNWEIHEGKPCPHFVVRRLVENAREVERLLGYDTESSARAFNLIFFAMEELTKEEHPFGEDFDSWCLKATREEILQECIKRIDE